MAQILGLPKLSPTMEEGVLAKWVKNEGDSIVPGTVIAEVETDKATMEFAPEDEGVLLKLLVKPGDTVPLGAPVAILGEKGEDISQLLLELSGQGKSAALQATPPATAAVKAAAPTAAKAPEPAKVSAPAPAPIPSLAAAIPVATLPAKQQAAGGRVMASPLARKMAEEAQVDIATIPGSGPQGRVIKRDVLAAKSGAFVEAPRTVSASPSQPALPQVTATKSQSVVQYVESDLQDSVAVPLSMMRKTIARRLTEAKTQIPHFYLTADCDAAPLLAYRAMLNETLVDEGVKISVNDLIIKAASLALRRVPDANASFAGDKILRHKRVHIGMAVAIDDGLVTPVVRDATIKGISTIALETKDLAERARARKLRPEEMSGGTFTVSNLGMFGVNHFAAIINPPESAILAVGATKKVPVVVGDQIQIGQRMALTLSCDHRVVDGALGAKLMQALIKILEKPQALAL